MAERSRVVGNLPAETAGLVGRGDELAEVVRLLRQRRVVTLSGVGGVGKTRLARRAAAELQPDLRDGAWWVELSSLQEGAMLGHPIAEALPLEDQSTRPILVVVAEYLAERELLLVLDTCEHVAEECAEVVGALMVAAPGVRVLATSRRPLDLAEEEVVALDPLPQADAMALLARRAETAVDGFTLTDPAEREQAERLCRRLEGLPLAIELAAARLGELRLAELNRRLEDRFAVLGETEQAVVGAEPPWHQALRTAIGWSHQLCTPAQRLAWARLSVFAGSFDAEAAARVLADEHLPAQEVPRLLAALVQGSILQWAPTAAGERYRMLDTVREFGAFWLRGLGEQDEFRRRHRDYYQALAHQADAACTGPEQVTWNDRMTTEYANVRAVLDFCLAEGDGHNALDISGSLWFFWMAASGFAREGRHYLNRALDLAPAPGAARAKALWALGPTAVVLGDTETSGPLAAAFREAVVGETEETAPAAALVEAWHLTMVGEHARAAELLEAPLRTRPGHGPYGAAWFMARVTRAFGHIQLGEFTEAAAVADELCAECSRCGETWGRAWGEYMRALAALALGRTDEAVAHARFALEGKLRLHNSVGIATVVDLLASAAAAVGHGERAARLLGIAEQIWHTLGNSQMGMPELVAARNACENQARRLMGDDAYKTAFDTGYDTDPDAGIAYALTPHTAAPPDSPVT